MMRQWSDEKVIRKAKRAGRTLTALAAVAALFALLLLFTLVRTHGAIPFLAWMAGAVALVSGGSLMLSLAARRGSPVAVVLALFLLAVQLGVSLAFPFFVCAPETAVRHISVFPGPILSGVVIWLLFCNWGALRELQRRGLRETAFGNGAVPKSGVRLCVAGALAFAVGLSGVSGGSFIARNAACNKGPRAIVHQARGFARLLATEEKALLHTLEALRDTRTHEGLLTARSHLERLEHGLVSIRVQAEGNAPFLSVLDAYGAAVGEWKKSLEMMDQPHPDVEGARQLQELAYQLRSEAVITFNRQFESFNTNPY